MCQLSVDNLPLPPKPPIPSPARFYRGKRQGARGDPPKQAKRVLLAILLFIEIISKMSFNLPYDRAHAHPGRQRAHFSDGRATEKVSCATESACRRLIFSASETTGRRCFADGVCRWAMAGHLSRHAEELLRRTRAPRWHSSYCREGHLKPADHIFSAC